MELKYTPRGIYNIEQATGKPLTEIIQSFEMKNLLVMVKEGLKTDEDGAFDAIEAYLAEKEGNDTIALFIQILEGLQKDGFLPRALPINKMREQMAQTLGKVEQQPAPQEVNTLGQDGKKGRPQQ